jgi:hypothetical protein
MIAFEYVTGSHTAVNIKKQYNAILKKYCIEKKIFKTIADQAANMKKALSDVSESNEIVGGVNDDNLINLTKLLIERNRKLDLLEKTKREELALIEKEQEKAIVKIIKSRNRRNK